MKNGTYILFSFMILLAISCNTVEHKKTNTNELPIEIVSEKIAHIEMDIEGMTCEIGCAKIIASKVSKLQGVAYSEVSFENKKGVFSYDENSISKEAIVAKINGIAGGNLYKVTNTKVLDSISK